MIVRHWLRQKERKEEIKAQDMVRVDGDEDNDKVNVSSVFLLKSALQMQNI